MSTKGNFGCGGRKRTLFYLFSRATYNIKNYNIKTISNFHPPFFSRNIVLHSSGETQVSHLSNSLFHSFFYISMDATNHITKRKLTKSIMNSVILKQCILLKVLNIVLNVDMNNIISNCTISNYGTYFCDTVF